MPEQNNSEPHLSCCYPTSQSISRVGIRMTRTENGKGWKRFKNQGKNCQKGIDNFVLVVGLYNHDSCALVSNNFMINLPLVVLKMWEPKL